MPSASKKCICQICTCGRHMCPHTKQEHIVLGDGANGDASKIRDLKRKQRKQWNLSDGGGQHISSATDRLNAKKILHDESLQSTSVTVEDKGNSQIDGGSWNSKQVPKRQIIKPHDHLKFEGDADFRTLNQIDYKKNTSQAASEAYEYGNSQQAINKNASGEHESWNQKQVPKTLPIKIPDSLKLSGPLDLETTHKSVYNETVFQAKEDKGDSTNRPRTSLKLSGPFETNSSYQRAFTPKHTEDTVKVRKGISMSNLKPEGDMSFDTTSLDYRAALVEKSKMMDAQNQADVSLKPKLARPPSEIKIPAVPLQDETTLVSDFPKWNVGKPERYKPPDTLQLGDTESEVDASVSELARKVYSDNQADAMARWQVSRPVVRKPQSNLKSEGIDFATTHESDYITKRERSRYGPQALETVAEHSESDRGKLSTEEQLQTQRTGQTAEEKPNDSFQKESYMYERAEHTDTGMQTNGNHVGADYPGDISGNLEYMHADIPSSEPSKAVHADVDIRSQNEEPMEYIPWEEIRPRPIRPHSNLRQEGGMEFSTTNRSEFVERSSERVMGKRPKTSTKIFEGDFDATTMNQIMFSHDQAEKVNPIRPKSNLHVESGEFVDETTNSREFQPWEIKRPSPIIYKPSLTQEGSIDFTTTNRTEFEEKYPEKVYPIRPKTTNKISGGDLDLTTTNQVMHAAFPIERVNKIVPQPNLRTSSGVFNGETTNRSQFQEYHVDRPKPIKPVSNLKQEGSMDFTTMNQLQFSQKPFEKVSQFRPQTSSKITGDFDGTTTNKVMFAAQPYERSQMIKPKGNLEIEKGEFSTDTTNHSEYQQWEQSKSTAITPRDNLQQEGNMDFTTTNNLQYSEKTSDKVSQIRPKTNSKITGEFDGTTTNQIMFQNRSGEKPKPIRPKTNLKLERGDFAAETTNNQEFQSWGYEKPNPIKPHSSIKQEGSMDFTTMNKMQFEGKSSERPPQIRPTTATKITGEFDGTTTNQIMFQGNYVEKVKGKRPSTNIHLESGKFEDQTTSRKEFQQWEMAKAEPIRPSGNLTQEGRMEFTTSNQAEFGEKPITKVGQIRPTTSSPITGEFDGVTTNSVMYTAQPMERVHDIRPKDNLRVHSGEFKTETTFSKEYAYKTGEKSEPIKPTNNLTQEGNFNFVTSNQIEYEQKTAEKVSSVRPKTQTKKNDGKFDGITTNQATFTAPHMETVQAIRPSTNIQIDDSKFQGNTTQRDEYQQWKVEKPRAFQLASSLKQEGDMNFETTNSLEFNEKGFERVQQIRPKTTSKIEGVQEITTTNQAMFHQPGKIDRVKPIRQQNNLHVETGKFANETTNSREYRQWVKMGNQDAVSKKKIAAAGIRTQRELSNRAKNESEKNGKPEANEYESWKNRHRKLENSERQNKNQTDAKNHVRNLENFKRDVNAAISNASENYARAEMTTASGSKKNKTLNGGNISNEQTDAETKIQQPMGTSSDSAAKDSVSPGIQDQEVKTSGKVHQELAADGKLSKNQMGDKENQESWKLARTDNTPTSVQNDKSQTDKSKNLQQITPNEMRSQKKHRPQDNLRIEHVPFDGTSTTRTEYKKWEVRRSSSKRRSSNLKQEGQMEFNTTSNDYALSRAYNANRNAMKAQSKADTKGSLSQTGNMEFSTTSKSSYNAAAAGPRTRNLRPRSSLRLGVSNTEDVAISSRSNPETAGRDHNELTSTSRASYVGYTPTRTIANRPMTSQKVGQGAFEGQSTMRSTFTPKENTDKPRTMKPGSHKILGTGEGLTGDSTYKSSFEQVKSHCPVLDLQAGKLPLTFNEEKNGHLFYAPRVQG